MAVRTSRGNVTTLGRGVSNEMGGRWVWGVKGGLSAVMQGWRFVVGISWIRVGLSERTALCSAAMGVVWFVHNNGLDGAGKDGGYDHCCERGACTS